MLARPKVYLAGPVSGCTYRRATEWRLAAIRLLAARGIEALDPMRAQQVLADTFGHDLRPLTELACADDVARRDFDDVDAADALLVDFDEGPPGTLSVGTACEIAYAAGLGKPLFVVCGDPLGNANLRHAFVRRFLTSVEPNLSFAVARVARHFETRRENEAAP